MAQTVSVRIDKEDVIEIAELSKLEKKSKSNVIREVLELGLKGKKIDLAIDKFRKKEITAWSAARLAGIPLSEFLDLLAQRNIDFHYGVKELEEDFEGLI